MKNKSERNRTMKSKLAVNGGSPVRVKPWLDNFTLAEEERIVASEVIKGGYLSLFEGSHSPEAPFSFWGGPQVQKLEQEWSSFYGSKFAVALNSATSGLYAAIGSLGIGYGDEVIVSPYTMSACAIAPLIYGAIPVFADVELETGCLLPQSIREKISPYTKAIIVVHQFGIPADMEEILTIAKDFNLKVVEDCAQAHGAKYRGRFVGTFGDIGVFSLNVNKTIQTGEGGICLTNNEDLRYRLALIRNHGEAVVGDAGYKDLINIAGYNFRLTELQAAIAREQLKKLDYLNQIRIELVNRLNDGIEGIDFLQIPQGRKNCFSSYYLYPLRFFSEKAGFSRQEFVDVLAAEGVKFYQGYVKPLYYQPLYQTKTLFKAGYPFSAPENRKCRIDYSLGICPNAEKLHFQQMLINEHIRFPHKEKDIDDIILAIRKVAEYE